MRHLLFAASAAAAVLAGAVDAQVPPAAATVPPRGPGMTRADANGDGVVTRDEAIAQADAQFDAMDANHDGKVTGDEMRAAFAARGRGPGGRFGAGGGTDLTMTRDAYRDRALARFDRNDANHDGRVDQAEMAAAREARMNRGGNGTAPPAQQ